MPAESADGSIASTASPDSRTRLTRLSLPLSGRAALTSPDTHSGRCDPWQPTTIMRTAQSERPNGGGRAGDNQAK